LAQFYFSKFLYEKGRGFGYFDDLERAEYLLELARRRVGPAFFLLNDLGNVRLESFKARMEYLQHVSPKNAKSEAIGSFQQAVQDFRNSVSLCPHQLRGHYNLAVIEADHRGNTQEAIKWLEIGLQYPNWEHTPVPELTCAGLFNLACYYARLCKNTEKAPEHIGKCLESLEKAAAIGQVSPEDVEREYFFSTSSTPLATEESAARPLPTFSEGDLYALVHSSDEHTRSRFTGLKQKLSANFIGGQTDTGGYY